MTYLSGYDKVKQGDRRVKSLTIRTTLARALRISIKDALESVRKALRDWPVTREARCETS